jgi:predicted transposase/invertase (TIGR01784 family)
MNGGRYINPYTDFGFKYLFGQNMNKDLLVSFLNALFHGRQNIVDLKYLNGEHLGDNAGERRAIFDVYCENDKGEKFIVEMQNVYQQFFKDRSVYYSTFPIRDQAEKGEWDFELKSVYTVGILNFVFDEDKNDSNYFHHEVKLMDVNRKTVFFDKLTFVYLEMPKFDKTEEELVTMFDKWMFVLKNLSRLMERPAALQERIFTRLFEAAEIARFSKEEQRQYDDSLKAYRDITNAINTARKDAREEGREEGMAKGLAKGREEGINAERIATAKKMKQKDLPVSIIAEITGLSAQEISKL